MNKQLNQIKNWLLKNNYNFYICNFVNNKGFIVNLEKCSEGEHIKKYIRKYYPNFNVEFRGNYTGIAIY